MGRHAGGFKIIEMDINSREKFKILLAGTEIGIV